MKEILIITSYFPPEIGAASNRIFHLAEGLNNRNYKVSVVTPLPNYPTGKIFDGYKGKLNDTSIENHITIHRLWIFASVSKNKFLRLIAMLSYSLSLIWFLLFNKIPKTVIVQSPPLLVAFASMLFLASKDRKLILNVSDLWPRAGLELGALKKNFTYHCLEKIEKFNYKRATLILAQSEEIRTHVLSINPNKDTFLYRNFPDFKSSRTEITEKPQEKIKLVYAGLLGVAQGVSKLCDQLDYTKIEFHIYGSGPEQKQIENFINKHPKVPVYYHGSLTRIALHKAILKYDITIIPLLNRIYGSVPSKIFEYAKLGLPILYFGGGEGEKLVEQYNLGWTSDSGNYEHLNTTINKINKSDLTSQFRNEIIATASSNFDFHKQLNQLVKLI